MKKTIKQKVKMLGALELDRQMKRKLESTNYSILQNFDVFQHPYCSIFDLFQKDHINTILMLSN
ncbi:unnamed protein product [Paramecium sonneborni]|uniref:Uncharacterized protein n=1 Tax=Paramecium sonneborni TaxID=65129 RepID=A0A8S1RGL1_9CILI|nr:unnamed protein product [Paramecium sonneborni]